MFRKINQIRANVILFFFAVLSIYSCEFVKKEDQIKLMELDHLETLFFPLDSVTIRNKIRMGYLEDLNLLYVHNENPKKIDFYDFDSQTLKETILFSGPDLDRINQKSMIHVISPDSIFIYDQISNSLILLLDKGREVSDIMRIIDRDSENFGIMPWCYFFRTNSGDFLFGVTLRGAPIKSAKASPILSFSTKTKNSKFYGFWPESYKKDDDMSFRAPSFTQIQDNIALSMGYSEEIQLISSSGELEKVIYSGSDLMHSFKSKKSNLASMEESLRFQLTNSKYRNLLYDESSGYLIREGSIGLAIPDDVSPISGEKFLSQNGDDIYFVLVIIDKEKGKIGEIHGPTLGDDAFSTKDGVFIQDKLTDPNNEDVLIVNKMRIK